MTKRTSSGSRRSGFSPTLSNSPRTLSLSKGAGSSAVPTCFDKLGTSGTERYLFAYKTSNNPAAPIPPPMHIVTTT